MGRLYIRLHIQKEFGWDDKFLIFGVCCIISAAGVTCTILDLMYELQGLVYADPATIGIEYALSILPKLPEYRRRNTTALILAWCSICCVKFSFLAMFRLLIRQLPNMIRYWYFTVALNVVVFCYGGTVFAVSCPYFTKENIEKSSRFPHCIILVHYHTNK